MTVEKRLMVSPADIRGITMECATCGGRLMASLSGHPKTPTTCPQCGTLWYDDGQDAVRDLAGAIKALTRQNAVPKVPYRVLLELEAVPDA